MVKDPTLKVSGLRSKLLLWAVKDKPKPVPFLSSPEYATKWSEGNSSISCTMRVNKTFLVQSITHYVNQSIRYSYVKWISNCHNITKPHPPTNRSISLYLGAWHDLKVNWGVQLASTWMGCDGTENTKFHAGQPSHSLQSAVRRESSGVSVINGWQLSLNTASISLF